MQFRLIYGKDPAGQGFYWPASEQKRTELLTVKRLKPSVFQSTYQCNPGAREGGIFTEDDFNYYRPPVGLEEGISNPNVLAFCRKGHAIFQSWDTAWDQLSTSDPSVCVTGLLVPCVHYHRNENVGELGECEPHFDILLLDVYREKLSWAALPIEFRRQWQRWRPEAAIVENKQSGVGLIQQMKTTFNVIGVTPQDSKRARVLEGVGAGTVQGWFRLHRVLVPYGAKWVRPYKRELKDFTGDKSGRDDQVDATAHLVQFAIELSVNAGLLPSDWSPDRIDEIMVQERAAPLPGDTLQVVAPGTAAEFLTWVSGLPGQSINPFGDICQGCGNNDHGFCRVQRRRVAAFDNCGEFTPRAA